MTPGGRKHTIPWHQAASARRCARQASRASATEMGAKRKPVPGSRWASRGRSAAITVAIFG